MSNFKISVLSIILVLVFSIFSLSIIALSQPSESSLTMGDLVSDQDLHILLKNSQFSTGSISETEFSSSIFVSSISSQNIENYYIVQFKGPVLEEWKHDVVDTEAVIFDYVPNNAFIVRMNISVKTKVEDLDSVGWVGFYEPSYSISSSLSSTPELTGSEDVIVMLFDPTKNEMISNKVTLLGGEILENSGSILKVKTDRSLIADIASINGVSWVDLYVHPVLFNDVASGILGVPAVDNKHGLNGSGQIVAVADTGLDTGLNDETMHDDIEGRVVALHAWWTAAHNLSADYGDSGAEDLNGHGTHVAGSVLGNGNRSSGLYSGTAPGAKLVFQALQYEGIQTANNGRLLTPSNLEILFQESYDNGARIHTNSWGTSDSYPEFFGNYSPKSVAIDTFMWDHPESLILFSAGNSGSGATTVSDQASSKNILTVGASENNRPYKGTSSDNINEIADFSSRGPTLDGRIKPDVVAPGTFINSTASSLVYNTNYTYMSGTSMATPLTAGTVALVRQYYTDIKSTTPSGALLKATLINGATDLGYASSAQGFGRVNVSESLFPDYPKVWMYADNTTGLSTNEFWNRTYAVSDISDLKVTLVWTDYPGTAYAATSLVNDLDLTVTGPNGTSYGNGAVDSINTVEQVSINLPSVGYYDVKVSAPNVPNGPQPFAVVISANFSDFTPPGNVSNLNATVGERWITWTWDNPSEGDFSHTEVYLNGSFQENIFVNSFTALDLIPNTTYVLSTRTVDIYNNINLSWSNSSINTTPDTTQPLDVSNLDYSAGERWINLSWTNPDDPDLSHSDVYVNGSFRSNVTGNSHLVSGLDPSTNYSFNVYPVDVFNNTNTSGNALLANTTFDTTPPLDVSDLSFTAGERWVNLIWTNPDDPDLSHADVYINGSFLSNVTDNFYLISGLDPSASYSVNVYSVDDFNNANTSSSAFLANTTPDITSPFSVTNLSAEAGDHWINLSWINPNDIDLSSIDVYVNNSLLGNTSGNFFFVNYLDANASYNLSTHTVDTTGNTNSTGVYVIMNTTVDNTPPGSVSSLSSSSSESSITWSWLNPSDVDNSHVELYLNAIFQSSSNGTSYSVVGLNSSSVYNLSTRTVDTSGNVNSSWVNLSSSTTAPASNQRSGSSSNGGGGSTTNEYFENIYHKEVVTEYVSRDVETTFMFSEDARIEYVVLLADSNVGSVKAIIEVLVNTSTLVPNKPDGEVYQNLNIWVGNYGLKKNIVSSSVGFKVRNDWIDENGIEADSISMKMYYNDVWVALPTKIIGKDDGFVHYETDTSVDILAPFAIVGHFPVDGPDTRTFSFDPDQMAGTSSLDNGSSTVSDEGKGQISNFLQGFVDRIIDLFSKLFGS
ncbi:S8 family serine peptidase [Methanococcoides burtonii]|uniref:Subtilase-family serine protease with fibronectin type III-like domains n=1 Tax=Methanococcoides burtonii (strain DSM 6242 / NBRC 107633 / OCM 468 / ACE-M) TaxID=259564 RepID=Q12XE7_METBU|nr:S8 family serine peptidase [Methanococcoides burtonii]ABE51879.1 Subtilase-family serine protease with fibronectin type III-like domains [Methanococcoides burtonii DSM 6242]